MQTGWDKYGPMNWRETEVVASTYKEAISRHMDTWWDGEDLTRDTNVKNLAAVMASCAILLDAELQGTLVDDRPPPGKLGDLIEALTKPMEVPEPNEIDVVGMNVDEEDDEMPLWDPSKPAIPGKGPPRT